jgi:NAD(P)-dependent dehydrogenase (short-subunit alcohol dehydrogenase family)
MESLEGAHAFVTGGASGIGLGVAEALAERGAAVTITDLREDHLAAARDHAEAAGWIDRAHFARLDVTDRRGFAAALDDAEARLGPLRILVNNAGVGIIGPVDEAGFSDWDWGLGVNLGGVANGLVLGLPRIKAHGLGGHVVNVSSQAGFLPARPGRGIYATTKAGLVALSEHLRLELDGKGIGVSVLCPGAVKTNIRESGRARPVHLREGSAFLEEEAKWREVAIDPDWLDPIEVGRMTVEAILADRLYIFSHPEMLPVIKSRFDAVEAALREAMERQSGN